MAEKAEGKHEGWSNGFLPMAQRVATIVIAAGVIWLGTQMQTFNNRLTSLEGALVSDKKLIALERRLDLSILGNKLEVLSTRSAAMGKEVEEIKRWFRTQVWGRLRQHGENVEILRHAVLAEHPDAALQMVDPEVVSDK